MLKKSAKAILKSTGVRREHVAGARMAVERATLASIAPTRNKRQWGRILAYHSVAQPRTGVNDVSLRRFERQLDMAIELGFEFVSALKIAHTGGAPNELAITVDDAWTSAAEQIAPILRKRGIPWSLFVVSGWSDHADDWTRKDILNWDQLKALKGEDLEIGSHSVTHPDFAKLTREQVLHELEMSRDQIADQLGFVPKSFAIPYGQSANWTSQAHELAKQVGYDTIYAQAENTSFPGTVRRTFITKFDNDRIFRAVLNGAFDNWEEWV